jgi:hypothetical protein
MPVNLLKTQDGWRAVWDDFRNFLAEMSACAATRLRRDTAP